MWGLGNEMEANGSNPRIWKAIDDLAQMVKSLDPNHPTMTVCSDGGLEKFRSFTTLCPNVDVLGVNSYGGMASLPTRLKGFGVTRPFIITEFGPNGPWEVGKTAWGAPLEPTSTHKAENILSNYLRAVEGSPGRCLRSYAFLWGHKQEATATWFGILLASGEQLETAEVMQYAWTKKWAANRSPHLLFVETELTNREVAPETPYKVAVGAYDVDGDPLTVRWQVTTESTDRKEGGDAEKAPAALANAVTEAKGMTATVLTPKAEGAYRLFITVLDGKGHAATANVCFFVKRR
jgi:hypothetical protein